MANAYRSVPLHWLDDIHTLNCSLEAYQSLLSAFLASPDRNPSDLDSFIVGLNAIFQPILEGYQEIEQNVRLISLVADSISDDSAPSTGQE